MDSSSQQEIRSARSGASVDGDGFSVSSTPPNLQLNSPVWIRRRGQPQLEGSVAYLGSVRFAAGDDWVGVRLTGASVEQGKNNGTVDEIHYFDTSSPHQGLFVRQRNVRLRTTAATVASTPRDEESHYEEGNNNNNNIPQVVTTPPKPVAMDRTPFVSNKSSASASSQLADDDPEAPRAQNMFRTPAPSTPKPSYSPTPEMKTPPRSTDAAAGSLGRIDEPERPPDPHQLASFAESLSPSRTKAPPPQPKGVATDRRLLEPPNLNHPVSTPLRQPNTTHDRDPLLLPPHDEPPLRRPPRRTPLDDNNHNTPATSWCQAVATCLLIGTSLVPTAILGVSLILPHVISILQEDTTAFVTQLTAGLLLGHSGTSGCLLLPLAWQSLCCCCCCCCCGEPSSIAWNAARVSALLSAWMGLLLLVLTLVFKPAHNVLLLGGSAGSVALAALGLTVSYWPVTTTRQRPTTLMRNRYPVLQTVPQHRSNDNDLAEPLLNAAENGQADDEQPEEAATTTTSRVRGTRRLLQLASSQVLYLYLGCIVLLIRLPFSLAIPHFVSTTLAALGRAEYHRARQEILYLLLLGSMDAVLDFWCVFLFGYANQRIVKGVRLDLFQRLLHMEVAFFDNHNSGTLASRLNSDCSEMAGDLTWFFRFSIESIVRITGITAYMLVRSPRLAACALSIVPLVGVVNKLYGDWLRDNAIAVQDALAEANAVAQEALSNVRTVIAFAAEDFEESHYRTKIEHQFHLNVQQLIMQGLYYMCISTFLINTFVQSFLLYFGAYLIERDQLTAEILLAFMLYQGQLQQESMNLFQSYSSLIKSSGAGDKVFALLDRHPPPPATGSGEEATEFFATEPLSYDLSLQNVSFSYPSRPEQLVLDNMFLDIPKGSTVALVGSSGCGKTTVVNLLQRFYDPSTGVIKLNGRDLRSYDLLEHRRRIGIVSQDCVLFDGSVLQNIIYGSTQREDVDDSTTLRDARRAASLAHADGFIEAMPHGYHTIVGEKGVQLSGGQRQRISIARAIYQRPLLLILDEATSALDRESEKLVQEALDDLLQHQRLHQTQTTDMSSDKSSSTAVPTTTTIVIAHRLHTVENADYIAVLSSGRVAEFGPPKSLLRRSNGLYRKLVEHAQQTGRIAVD